MLCCAYMTKLQFLRALAALVSLTVVSCGKKEAGTVVVLTGSSTIAPVISDVAKRYEAANPGVRIEVQSGGSSRGIADALSGTADLGMASRALSADEAAKLTAHQIAADGVCVVVHRDNPVSELSREQLIRIYTKTATNWKDFGGSDATIVVANKAEGRSTLEVFLHYLGLDNADVKADVVVGENLHVINSVVANPNTIGYVSIGTAASESKGGTPIKLVSTGGVAATTENVANGTFPITRPLNIVEDARTSPAAKAFLAHLTSPAINDIIQKHFFVPVN
ncbi:MAG: phosphate ABC transporter substrate-binding protein [Verrucomicrobiaceae bacterium]|nr:MAG: phosphate ABC transporter substrate-binding protein [Verrucomicrobiaceae bacterium]